MIELNAFQEAVNVFAEVGAVTFLIPFTKASEDDTVVVGCSWLDLCGES